MSTETVNWNIAVPKALDLEVRRRLGLKGRNPDEIARFVEEIISARLFDEMIAANRALNAGTSDEELQAIVDEAVDAVGAEMWGPRKNGTD